MTPSLDPDDFGTERLLVVAPHPDDEALGCGGLIAALTARGRRVAVVFVTDGGGSHPGSVAWPRARLADRRRGEALASLAELGVPPEAATFLDLPDADMPAPDDPRAVQAERRLTALIAALDPDLVVVPWRRDPHRDHRDAFDLSTRAIAAAGRSPRVWEYAVWLDELGAPEDHPRPGEARTVRLDIASVRDRKRAAVARHLSQLGGLIDDDPAGFVLTPATIDRLTGPVETYWRPA